MAPGFFLSSGEGTQRHSGNTRSVCSSQVLPLPARNERGEGRLLKCMNYASGSVLIFAQTLRAEETVKPIADRR